MKVSRIKETCIYVNDLQKTSQFYHEVLGLPVISTVKNRHVFFQAGDSVLLCFIAEQTLKETLLPPHGASGSIHFAFEVAPAEYEASLQKIQAAAIPVLHQHSWKNGLRSFYFHDPDAHLVEIIEEGVWEG